MSALGAAVYFCRSHRANLGLLPPHCSALASFLITNACCRPPFEGCARASPAPWLPRAVSVVLGTSCCGQGPHQQLTAGTDTHASAPHPSRECRFGSLAAKQISEVLGSLRGKGLLSGPAKEASELHLTAIINPLTREAQRLSQVRLCWRTCLYMVPTSQQPASGAWLTCRQLLVDPHACAPHKSAVCAAARVIAGCAAVLPAACRRMRGGCAWRCPPQLVFIMNKWLFEPTPC